MRLTDDFGGKLYHCLIVAGSDGLKAKVNDIQVASAHKKLPAMTTFQSGSPNIRFGRR